MYYELVDLETANVIRTFTSEDEALASVLRMIDAGGAADMDTIALGRGEDDGEGEELARGQELVTRALAVARA